MNITGTESMAAQQVNSTRSIQHKRNSWWSNSNINRRETEPDDQHTDHFCGSLTRMCNLPLKREDTSSISFSLWSLLDASQTDPVTTKPFPCHFVKHLVSSSWFLEHVWTTAPSSANSSTTACLHQPQKQANQTHKIHKIDHWTLQKNGLLKRNRTWVRNFLEEENDGKWKGKCTDPIPRVPPVTRAVMPLRDHFDFLIPATALSAPAIGFWVSSSRKSLILRYENNCWSSIKHHYCIIIIIKLRRKKRKNNTSFHRHNRFWLYPFKKLFLIISYASLILKWGSWKLRISPERPGTGWNVSTLVQSGLQVFSAIVGSCDGPWFFPVL